MLDNAHGHAAIDSEILPCDEVILHQLQYGAGHIFRFTFAMERYPIPDVVLRLRRRHGIMEGSANDARRNTIDADIVVCEFARQNACKLRQGTLNYPVCYCAEATTVTSGRAD